LNAEGTEGQEKSPEDKAAQLVQKHLFHAREILLTGAVTERSSRAVISQLLALEAAEPERPITLIVNSPGGSVSDGFAIFDTIQFIRSPVRILTTGMCASIATIVLIAVPRAYRVCTPNTRLLIHQPHIPMQVYGPASDLEITANEILKTRGKINRMLAEGCGQPVDKLELDTQRDYWMSAGEALEYGLITHVVSSRAEFDAVTANMTKNGK
jgi:ATP-dependent Clp protease protease subunit